MDRGGYFDSSALDAGTFTVQPDADAAISHRRHVRASIAQRTVARQHARFASAEAQLAEMLPARFHSGEVWNILSNGDIDALSYVKHIMRAADFDAVILACWAISRPAIEFLEQEVQAGRIKRLDAYCGDIMPRDRPDLYTQLCTIVAATAGRAVAFKTHAKIWLFLRADGSCTVMQTSANPNYNKRTEQTVISADPATAATYKSWFDALDLPAPTFPDWHPHVWPPAQAHRAQAH